MSEARAGCPGWWGRWFGRRASARKKERGARASAGTQDHRGRDPRGDPRPGEGKNNRPCCPDRRLREIPSEDNDRHDGILATNVMTTEGHASYARPRIMSAISNLLRTSAEPDRRPISIRRVSGPTVNSTFLTAKATAES
jgi:hypothetical protein